MIFVYYTGIVTSGCSDPGFVPNALHSPRGGPHHEGSVEYRATMAEENLHHSGPV